MLFRSAAYLESAGRGEVHYWHHLSDFYSDVRVDAEAAVLWAGRDLELRSNFNTQGAMGLALHVAGRSGEAVSFVDLALGSGARDAHLFSLAAVVYRGAGKVDAAERCASAGARINPWAGRFHVHR